MKVVMNVDNDQELKNAVKEMVEGAIKGEVRERINKEVEKLVNETLTETRITTVTNKMVENYTGYAQRTVRDNIDSAIEKCIRYEVKEKMKGVDMTSIVAKVLQNLFESRGIDLKFVQDSVIRIPEPRIVKGKD